MKHQHPAQTEKKQAPAFSISKAEIRGRLLVSRGLTLKEWAAQHNWPHTTLHNALAGIRHGPKSRLMVETLRQEIGL